MYKKLVAVYEGERELGEVELTSENQNINNGAGGEGNGVVWKEIRINQYSRASERCPPLAVLHTITSNGNGDGNSCCCLLKMEAKFSQSPESPLSLLHSTCLTQNKTAIMSLGDQELHLVAMHSWKYEGNFPCFWGFTVATGLYHFCLAMLNLRCLGILFDLDETLIVANTMRSFEDRIEVLQQKINLETDLQRVTGMLAEIKRYQDDQLILKQYVDNDQVVDDGKVIKSQSEVVPSISKNHPPIIRPLIRLQDKNITLTRINPQIRDTSVLVRLRPAWEDLESYLTARGRKRFEVYVCTMAERDYALEMWRLLDPDSNLINPKELFNHIFCVKPGSRKSLFHVFQDRNCHPKMALVVDDRLKVWDERDQPRVHVVPAFAPYYAPQAEANNTVPVLCLARNIACNVRGGFFKDFDEGLLPRISEVAYEDDIKEIPSPPDVSNYLVSEDDPSATNGNKETLGFDGMADAEVERRLKEAASATSTVSLTINNLDPRTATALPFSIPLSSSISPLSALQESVVPFPNRQLTPATSVPEPSLTQISPRDATILQSSPATEEGEVPESELDLDTRRRLLILQHGQDTRDHAPSEPQFPARSPPIQVPVPRVPSRGLFPGEEKMSTIKLSRVIPPKEFPSNAELKHFEKHHPRHTPFGPKVENYMASDTLIESQKMSKEPHPRDDRLRLNQSVTTFQSFPANEVSLARSPCGSRDDDLEPGRVDPYVETTPAGALQDIALKCGTKVEFKLALVSSTELQFVIEVLFAGEKIGEGLGRTRREAHSQAVEGSLMNLAVKYLSCVKTDSGSMPGIWSLSPGSSDKGFLNDANSFGYKEDITAFPTQSDAPSVLDPRFEAAKRPMSPIAALKELCTREGLALAFPTQPQFPTNPGQRTEVFTQVEIDGKVLGKGIGSTWDDAKSQAAARALGTLKSMLGHFPHKRQISPRSLHGMSNKRLKPDYTRVLQQMPASARFSKNASSVQ